MKNEIFQISKLGFLSQGWFDLQSSFWSYWNKNFSLICGELDSIPATWDLFPWIDTYCTHICVDDQSLSTSMYYSMKHRKNYILIHASRFDQFRVCEKKLVILESGV